MEEELTEAQQAHADRMNIIARYTSEITAYEKEKDFEKWHVKRAPQVYKRYVDQRPDASAEAGAKKTNILWSNTKIMTAAVFSRLPKPDVSRRYNNRDPVGRVASIILERALTFEQEQYLDFEDSLKSAVKDRYLPGRGTVWVRYEPTFGQRPVQVTEDEYGQFVDDDGDSFTVSDMDGNPTDDQDFDVDDDDNYYQTYTEHEKTCIDYVNWDDFGHQIARTWEEVGIVWRRVRMDKAEVEGRFKDTQEGWELDQLPYTDSDEKTTEKNNVKVDPNKRAKTTVYEVWDKEKKRVIWLSKHVPVPLDMVDDPLELQDFWPLPKPLLATTTTDSLCPTPDFCQYQDQAGELDLLTARKNGLIEALQIKGVYDAEQDSLKRLLTEGQANELVPVTTWMAFAEKGGIKGVVDFMPLDQVVGALSATYEAIERTTETIYEISGIADIMRGRSNPNDALGTQKIKSSYASLRSRPEQDDVEKFAAHIIKIRAEIMCNFYSDETLLGMALVHTMSQEDQQYVPQALAMLRDDVRRNFSIGVEADSMIQMDQEMEKASRNELLVTVGGYLEKAVLGAQQFPQLGPLLGEMLMFGLRGHKIGRDIESTFEEVVENFKNTPQEQSDDGRALEQAKSDAEMSKISMTSQMNERKHVLTMQEIEAKANAQIRIEAAQAEADLITGKNSESTPNEPEEPVDEGPSEMQQMLMTLQEGQAQLAQAIQSLATAQSAPRKLIRDDEGRAVGSEIVH